ncbi:MAG: hypothetical protein WC729_14465 [Sphingomonas sp.]|uniref:hypothetical protein n=1 Tax=Sphingomonas sp. TaxID=28214 RepID=UPI00356B24CF
MIVWTVGAAVGVAQASLADRLSGPVFRSLRGLDRRSYLALGVRRKWRPPAPIANRGDIENGLMTLHAITWTIGETKFKTNYKHKLDHRDATPGKSQWTIPEISERQSFTDAMVNSWVADGWGWGIHAPGGALAMLGVDRDHKTQVFFARFDHDAGEWHGYPVNYKIPQQKPPGQVLRAWLAKTFIAKAQMRKIVKGQPCRI